VCGERKRWLEDGGGGVVRFCRAPPAKEFGCF